MVVETVSAAAAHGDRMLSVAPSPAFWAALAMYGGAAAAYLAAFVAGRPRAAALARGLLVAAVVAHGVDIGWRGVERVHPAVSVREALGFLAWISAGGFLAATWRYRVDLAGVVAAPASLAVLAVARLSPAGEAQAGLSALGRIHIVLAVSAVALFAIASVLALLYVQQDRDLRRKRFDAQLLQGNAAPLERLDTLMARLVAAGVAVFTVAVGLGAAWVAQRDGDVLRPEYPVAGLAWLAFAAAVATRAGFGWRGRRTAGLVLAGFAAAVAVLVIYLVRRSVGG